MWSKSMSVDHDISVLNSLIKTTLDSRKGFRDAAEQSVNTQFQRMFEEFSEDRSRVAARMQEQVRRLGGNPEDDSSFLAAAHRTFLDLRAALSGSDDRTVIAEVERGEDYIKGKFEEALNDDELSPDTRAVVQEAYASVRKGHDRASALKHGLA
jgi:uncharacterized protein (TIGR02284 family)